MRIRDWSSDVCSSDLPPAAEAAEEKPKRKRAPRRRKVAAEAAPEETTALDAPEPPPADMPAAEASPAEPEPSPTEIPAPQRSEERRVGKERVSPTRPAMSPDHYNKNRNQVKRD